MDVAFFYLEDAGFIFKAVSKRAVAFFADTYGTNVTQFMCEGSPEDVLSRFPKDYLVGEPVIDKKDVN